MWACTTDQEGRRDLSILRWGLVPHWSQGPDSRYSMMNARAETVHEKPAYRDAFRHRRCLIPADGSYEWEAGHGKQPYFIHRRDGAPTVLGGFAEGPTDPGGPGQPIVGVSTLSRSWRMPGLGSEEGLMPRGPRSRFRLLKQVGLILGLGQS